MDIHVYEDIDFVSKLGSMIFIVQKNSNYVSEVHNTNGKYYITHSADKKTEIKNVYAYEIQN